MPRKSAAPRKRYPSDDWAHRKATGSTGRRQSPAPATAAAAKPRRGNSVRRSPTAPAAPAPTASAPPDYRAFTLPRGRAAGKRLPTLAELAAEESPALATIGGGLCPGCQQPHGDDDRHCAHCGVGLRHACPKCDRPLRGAESFCRECGTPAAQLELQAPALELPPPAPAASWEPDDCFLVSAAVDFALVKFDAPILDDKDRDRINRRAAAVANKHFRIGGRWKEEMALGMAICGALFPAAYTYFVVGPDEVRERREREARRARGNGHESSPVAEVH